MKTLYIDMDGVLVDFEAAIGKLDAHTATTFKGKYEEVHGFFSMMDPVEGALAAFETLSSEFDTYILSTAPWKNPSAWSDKLLWVKKHLGAPAYKRLILSHHKNLCAGDFLVDDRVKNGAGKFKGEHIQFGTEPFKDWQAVLPYLLERK